MQGKRAPLQWSSKPKRLPARQSTHHNGFYVENYRWVYRFCVAKKKIAAYYSHSTKQVMFKN